jgi:hypothetical protein
MLARRILWNYPESTKKKEDDDNGNKRSYYSKNTKVFTFFCYLTTCKSNSFDKDVLSTTMDALTSSVLWQRYFLPRLL